MLPMRPPSSTVVVNRHAQFMPHTDSGAGHGQSKSLIVALGAFTGGELVVEGDVSNIRYRPLEFDGWKQRHWTLPFGGERFSLVWFTPHGCAPSAPTRHRILRTGAAMPILGLGTFRQKGDAVYGQLSTRVSRHFSRFSPALSSGLPLSPPRNDSMCMYDSPMYT